MCAHPVKIAAQLNNVRGEPLKSNARAEGAARPRPLTYRLGYTYACTSLVRNFTAFEGFVERAVQRRHGAASVRVVLLSTPEEWTSCEPSDIEKLKGVTYLRNSVNNLTYTVMPKKSTPPVHMNRFE